MKNFSVFTLIGILVFVCASCEKISKFECDAEFDQRIYFQVDTRVSGWTNSHQGWYLDSFGKIICYYNPGNLNNRDSLGYIHSTVIDKNIEALNPQCHSINKCELILKIPLIKEASQGVLSESYTPSDNFDFESTTRYYAFLFDDASKTYQRILLRKNGDLKIENSSSESYELYDWLGTIDFMLNHKN